MNPALMIIIILLIILLIIFYVFEKKKTSIKEISLIATMAGLAGISRVPFAPLPNIQPTTFLIIVSGWVFGPIFGFMVGSVSVIVSNLFLGHGPWTPWQMLAWGMAGFMSGIIGRGNTNPPKLFLALYGFVWGFLYDYIMNLWNFIAFVYPHTLSSFIAVYSFSFYFDLMHAVSNYIFLYFFGHEIINILSRFKQKLSYFEE
jgi:energy-coupling factor transport system substrate-specific component